MIVDRSVPAEHAAYMTHAEFLALPEYSATLPTGQTEGKRWRRHLKDGRWFMGEYGGVDDQGRLIYWHEIYITTPSMREELAQSWGNMHRGAAA